MNTQNLRSLGWNDFFEEQLQTFEEDLRGLEIGRVAIREGIACELLTPEPLTVAIGKASFAHNDKMVTGDWVAYDPLNLLINFVFQRSSEVLRKVAGDRTEVQPLVANVDTIFITTAIGEDFSPARLERYLAAVWSSNAEPIVLVSKADLPHDKDRIISEIQSVSKDVQIMFSSIDDDRADMVVLIPPGKTAALLGSSGVGKSTLVNRIAQTDFKTKSVREKDQKGRHTTTQRTLIQIPGGGLIVDTPGIRELSLWDADVGLKRLFEDVIEASQHCKFRDCKHEGEPGCGIGIAMEEGIFDARRLERYKKLERENVYFDNRIDERRKQNERSKKTSKKIKHMKKMKRFSDD